MDDSEEVLVDWPQLVHDPREGRVAAHVVQRPVETIIEPVIVDREYYLGRGTGQSLLDLRVVRRVCVSLSTGAPTVRPAQNLLSFYFLLVTLVLDLLHDRGTTNRANCFIYRANAYKFFLALETPHFNARNTFHTS